MRITLPVALVLSLAVSVALRGQPVFRGSEIFPPEEFAARRLAVMDRIGDGVAIVRGATEPPGEMPFRQNSQFFYLTGVVEPRATVILDGRSKQVTLFLLPRNERRERNNYGPALSPGDAAVGETGIGDVRPLADIDKAIGALAAAGRALYTPFGAEVLGSQSFGDPTRLWTANRQDRWDGRDSREATFVGQLRAAAPQSAVRDLDPILNLLRAFKSPREVAVIREATRIAGQGIIEAMRDARPGMTEYELQADAEFVFKRAGALGGSYFALVATGTNTYYTHYHRNTARLIDGDLVQFDYAPDYKYYQSDVTRVFPANGRFSARQRELYGVYLALYRALLTSIRVHATPAEVVATAVAKMDDILTSYRFTDARIESAARAFVEAQRRRTSPASLGHNVGLEVHDVGGIPGGRLEPGMVFTIEPQMRIDEERIGIRLEDMILITESGYENLSAFVPVEIDDIERVMAEPGLSDALRTGRP